MRVIIILSLLMLSYDYSFNSPTAKAVKDRYGSVDRYNTVDRYNRLDRYESKDRFDNSTLTEFEKFMRKRREKKEDK